MSKKIKINIPGFGERYYSNEIKYDLFHTKEFYTFYKNETSICHNEYGPCHEVKNGNFIYMINNEWHRLDGPAYYNAIYKNTSYYAIGAYLGNTKEYFVEHLANILIPKE